MNERHAAAIDKLEIVETLNAYMQAIDRADVATLRNRVFTADARIDLLNPVDVDDYCAFVTAIMGEIRTQHFLMNSLVVPEGDTAQANSYFVGFHRVPASPNSDACEAIFGTLAAASDVVIGGTYADRLVRTPAGWRIRERRVALIWQNQSAAGKTIATGWIH